MKIGSRIGNGFFKDTSFFIKQAIELHGEVYDYSKVDYKDNRTHIIIMCKIHGEFKQRPGVHLRNKGIGCPKCSSEKRKLTNEEFILKAEMKHGKQYDYSKINYTGLVNKINIICSIHGEFTVKAINHINHKAGCPTCAADKKINDKNLKHNNKVLTSNFKFNNSSKKYYRLSLIKKLHEMYPEYEYGEVNYIKIICKIHGAFFKTDIAHINGAICNTCAYSKMSDKTLKFLNKSFKIHKDKYDYSKSEYVHCQQKIKIICEKHGLFLQTPNEHLNGKGCSACSNIISNKETNWLNSLNIPSNIRNKTLNINGKIFRPDALDQENKIVYEFLGDYWHGNPNIYNPDDFNEKTKCTFGELYSKTLAKNEAIAAAGYKIIKIWESDWDKS